MTATWRPRSLSVSAIQLYTECPAAYRRRYVERIFDPSTGPLAFGRAMAKALEAEHSGTDGDVAWVRAYDLEVIQAGVPGAASIQHGLALLAAYRAGGVAVGKPEHRFEVYLPDRDAVPVPLVGVMDLAGDDGVWEWKTGRTKWDQGRCDTSPQAALYRYAYLREFGRKPQWVQFVVMSTARVEVQRFLTYPAGPELMLFELQAAAVWRGICRGEYPPKCRRCPACEAAGVVSAKPEPSGYPSLEWAT
jgi:PD-(D/E)XK nuclease superfamily